MATRVKASAVIPARIEKVWERLRLFTFPAEFFTGVTCTMVDGSAPTCVGAVREMKWASGEMRKHRLLTLSDLHFTSAWEVVECVPESEVIGAISTVTCTRITENEHTLVEWAVDFSSDVRPEVLKFEQNGLALNLREIREKLH